MVNISAPKKYHTFNENEIPSHKESSNKITLNGGESNDLNGDSQNKHQSNKDVIYFQRPLVRTASNINGVSLKTKVFLDSNFD